MKCFFPAPSRVLAPLRYEFLVEGADPVLEFHFQLGFNYDPEHVLLTPHNKGWLYGFELPCFNL